MGILKRLTRSSPTCTALIVAAGLLLEASCGGSAANDDDDGPSPTDDDVSEDDDVIVPTSTGDDAFALNVSPAELDLDLFETAQLNFSGPAPTDVQYTIQLGPNSPAINFFNASPGAYEPMGARIVNFHTPGEDTFAVSLQVECLIAATLNVTFTLETTASSPSVTVPITCAGGTPEGSSTGAESESDTEDETTTGPGDGVDLICRYLYGETLQSVVVEGPNTGVEDFEPGSYVLAWDTGAAGGAVVAAVTSKANPVGFGRWDSAQDLLRGEPSAFVEDSSAPNTGRACASSTGVVFTGAALDTTFCDFDAGTCSPLGLDDPLLECACVGTECVGYTADQAGFLYSDDGGQTFSPTMPMLQPSALRTNDAGGLLFRNDATGTIYAGPALGGPFSESTLPKGAELLGPNLLGDGVAFLGDLGFGTSLTLRSTDAGATFQEVEPPGGVALGQMVQLADGRVLAHDADFTLWLSTSGDATDWTPRDDLELLLPSDCLSVGGR